MSEGGAAPGGGAVKRSCGKPSMGARTAALSAVAGLTRVTLGG